MGYCDLGYPKPRGRGGCPQRESGAPPRAVQALRGSGGGSARETLQPVSPSDTATPAKPPSGYGVTLVMAVQSHEYLKPSLGAVKNSYGHRWFHRPRYVMMAGVTRKPAAGFGQGPRPKWLLVTRGATDGRAFRPGLNPVFGPAWCCRSPPPLALPRRGAERQGGGAPPGQPRSPSPHGCAGLGCKGGGCQGNPEFPMHAVFLHHRGQQSTEHGGSASRWCIFFFCGGALMVLT